MLKNKERDKIIRGTIKLLRDRVVEGGQRRFDNSEKDDLSDINFKLTEERIIKEFDELLCSIEPKFEEAIRNKSNKENIVSTIRIPKGKPSKRKSNIKHFEREAESYIKANLKFYRSPKNDGIHPTQKQLAILMNWDDSTLSRRVGVKGVDAPQFLLALENKIDQLFDAEKFEAIIGRPQEGDDKKILNHIALDVKDKISAIKIGTDSPIKRPKEEPRDIDQLEKYSNEIVDPYANLDEGGDSSRKCDYCDKEYTVHLSEDNDPGQWAKAAKKEPRYYRKLVCSDDCYELILEQNGLDTADYPISSDEYYP